MINFKIEGENLPIVICNLKKDQSILCGSGAMNWKTSNVEMHTTVGDLKKAFGRVLYNESFFFNEFIAKDEDGTIAFSSNYPGSIIAYELNNSSIIIQKSSFLAMEKGLNLSMHINKKISVGFFSGSGFIMQKVEGSGTVFFEIDGHCSIHNLKEGESIIVDTNCVAGFTSTCSIDIEAIKGVKNVLFGNEGLFNAKITGPGKLFTQSMPISKLASNLFRFMPKPREKNF